MSFFSDEIFMQLAIKKAWHYQGLTYPNPAVGALIVYNNEIIALEAHQRAGTSHAEVLALLSAYRYISKKELSFNQLDANKAHDFLYTLPKKFFSMCTIYVTLEPCSHVGKTPSCASLLSFIKPKKVVIALHDPIKGHDGGIERLKANGIEVTVNVCQKEAQALIEPFLIWQKRAFVLFKLAQTSNGKIGGGYLSSQESLTHVHELRAVCSKMLIGGNTVRMDRPTLDCRFTGESAPDIIIYAKEDNFDREIPLFSVPNREVQITNLLTNFDKPSFVLIEGGEGMFNALQDKIDWTLHYQTPMLSTHRSNYDVDMKLKFLHQEQKAKDLMLWSRNIGKI